MMEKVHGFWMYECDICHEVFETNSEDWDDAHLKMKAEGWRPVKVGTEWCHICEDCKDTKEMVW
jgi:tRNA U54 and U55 pseudouridine synthase Pus10